MQITTHTYKCKRNRDCDWLDEQLELKSLKQNCFRIPVARRKMFSFVRHIGKLILQEGDSLSDWQDPLWVGCGEFACTVTVISHNLTCIPPSVMVKSWNREEKGREAAWWDGTVVNVSCLRSNLWGILFLTSMSACVSVLCTKEPNACRSTLIYSVLCEKVALIILVEVTTFLNDLMYVIWNKWLA